MKYDVTHILTSLKKEGQRYGKGHVEIRKMEKKTQIYLLQLDSVFKKNQWLNPYSSMTSLKRHTR